MAAQGGEATATAATATAATATTTTSRTIIFLERWGRKSWRVAYDGPYENDRDKHVECVGFSPHAGMQCVLSNLHCDGKAVMWDVEGVTNGSHGAHFTVYFGNDARQKVLALL